MNWKELLDNAVNGDRKSLARLITLVENEHPGYDQFLQSLSLSGNTHIIGITGPPGAGKSTLADAVTGELVQRGLKIAILCVDPSSPFSRGALLGDRVRMSSWYNHPSVYIRSFASRGNLGGLAPKMIEIIDTITAIGFDYIIVETVGIGQNEVEIAALADTTVLALVPEAGDDIQAMKSGIMEIADIFVVNKSDRPGAGLFANTLTAMVSGKSSASPVPVLKTVATEKQGIAALVDAIINRSSADKGDSGKKLQLLTEKTYQLIQKARMHAVDRNALKDKLRPQYQLPGFNLYKFVQEAER